MQAEFQVLKDGAIIYSRLITGGLPERFPQHTAIALADFMQQKPRVSLTDEGVALKWVKRPQSKTQ